MHATQSVGSAGLLFGLCRKEIREDGVDVFVEIDVGSEYNANEEQIRSVLYNVVKEGAIASYSTSVQGFQFRRLGVGKTSRSTETGATVTQEFAVYLQQMKIYQRGRQLP